MEMDIDKILEGCKLAAAQHADQNKVPQYTARVRLTSLIVTSDD